MTKPDITILTDPMPWGRELIFEGMKRIALTIRDIFIKKKRNYYNHGNYRGHFAVTRSLVEGLRKVNAKFNYNPIYPWQMANTVIVLAGNRTLRQAILFKQKGKIKKLFAGPNIVVFSSDYDSILAAKEVDAAITPSDWVVEMYLEDNPSLKNRIFPWPAGVDTNYWRPDPTIKRDQILIFEKQNIGPVGPITPYVDYLFSLGWKVEVIQYGTYTHSQYLRMLQRSCMMVGFVVSESQGLAWAEAWSADVPTLILNKTSNIYRGRRYNNSSAPYLFPQNGLFFDDFEDFKTKFTYWEIHRDQFSARAWTLENMSDEVCAAQLYKKITEW